MRFLAGGAAIARHDEVAGGEAFGLAAATTEEGDAVQFEVSRFMERGDDVGGVAAGCESNHEVAGASEAGDLAGEHLVVAVIVADAGDERAVG